MVVSQSGYGGIDSKFKLLQMQDLGETVKGHLHLNYNGGTTL